MAVPDELRQLDALMRVGPGHDGILDQFVSALRTARPAWHADALCKEHPEVSFYPERGESSQPAKDICARCLVQTECAAYAAEANESHGIWGSQSARQRRQAHHDQLELAAHPVPVALSARPGRSAGTISHGDGRTRCRTCGAELEDQTPRAGRCHHCWRAWQNTVARNRRKLLKPTTAA